MPGSVLFYLKYPTAIVCLVLVVFLLYKIVTTRSQLPFAGVPPMWSRGAPVVEKKPV